VRRARSVAGLSRILPAEPVLQAHYLAQEGFLIRAPIRGGVLFLVLSYNKTVFRIEF